METRKTNWSLAFVAAGFVLTSCGIVFQSGALARSVGDHERRITGIESIGSPGLREHEKSDDQRVMDLTSRVNRLEDAVSRINALDSRLSRIEGKLDQLLGEKK